MLNNIVNNCKQQQQQQFFILYPYINYIFLFS